MSDTLEEPVSLLPGKEDVETTGHVKNLTPTDSDIQKTFLVLMFRLYWGTRWQGEGKSD